MKLPNALSAVVEREKVVDYLLNRTHRYGASKAEFFFKYGFLLDKWEVLAQACWNTAKSMTSSTLRKPVLVRVS
jgi:hypothetical protein